MTYHVIQIKSTGEHCLANEFGTEKAARDWIDQQTQCAWYIKAV